MVYNVLNIDAMKDGDSWTWNNWTKVGIIDSKKVEKLTENEDDSRPLLKWFFDNGYLTEMGLKSCCIFDDKYNVLVAKKKDLQPLYAIDYGAF